jgi:hypothetical protein
MPTGKIKDLFPPGNDGSQDGAGRVTDNNTGIDYVFLTPDQVSSTNVPLSAGISVTFDIDASAGTGANIQKS